MKRHGFFAGGMVEGERTEMKWMNAARSECHGTVIGITLLVMGVTSFGLVFFSVPVSYEMWSGDISPGDRIPGDAFARRSWERCPVSVSRWCFLFPDT
ncbi:hypothetical protein [Oleiagrimonas sp. MCCC 1A03011]|uniref:hypothetical protein n=1 Tax=Oleiagrimonas sp. MCCC 1A03011 TaxID=1926883 RepID=UPI000DC400ED|nr:hypothetical protein [Oleiagrimonas sp. MCCC 1A03011]RAP58199.1 hypothetical protein BTJ49_04255 [Oleiagrimonas sp. MCCC 1A03011]